MDDKLDEAKTATVPGGDFEAEIYLSTDGKHTVHVKADNDDDRKNALKWAKIVYEAIQERYGTKQEQNKKTYQEDLGKCAKCGAPNKMSSKGKPYCSALCWKENE